ncbi:MAG: hypothetical protein A2939_00755 [Parcubacteria group bacterium RIFCSPLOWO2_01_FULL_48_18]|nr:MAG: hypothetical protein A3J67_01550 [Parcubacteria group bacterium RIFCSPHIGHO2_02_FULL_48_10b]OHB22006.1 MAG: hypothetical protein A2939_00755 [Parcubacteria group bacterium RIFCSPLOWO2_01_FULL_48_18]
MLEGQFPLNTQFYLRSEAAWEAMLADCKNAKHSIDFEQYIFNYDEVGKRFVEAFLKKAREGVRVRMLLDGAGSFPFCNSRYPEELRREGIEAQFFNPIRKWQLHNISSWFLRDHRKILVIDSGIGYIGGVGIHARMKGWRDTHMKLAGSIVRQMQSVFDRMWEGARRGKRFIRFRKSHLSSYETAGLLTNSPRIYQRFIYHALRRAIRAARSYIYLATPYFVPSVRVFRALRGAARRGIDVRILLPVKSDIATADVISGSYFTLALKAGIRIFLYRDSMFHAKTVVIDGRWATAGSANLDNLSLLFNYESNIVSVESSFVQELRNHFFQDFHFSDEVLLYEWIRRPFVRKALELVTWPLHGFF